MTTLTLPLGMTAADSGSDSPPASDCDTVSIGLSNSRDAADQIPFSLSEASFALYPPLEQHAGAFPGDRVPSIFPLPDAPLVDSLQTASLRPTNRERGDSYSNGIHLLGDALDESERFSQLMVDAALNFPLPPHKSGPIVIVSSYTRFGNLAHGPRGREAKRGFHTYRLNISDGTLTLLSTVAEGFVENPAFTRSHPSLNVVYACTESVLQEGQVVTLGVDPKTGALSQHCPPVGAGGSSTCYLTIHHAARRMLCVNYWNSIISTLELMPDGRVGSILATYDPNHGRPMKAKAGGHVNHSRNDADAQAERQADPHSHAIVLEPTCGTIAYVPDLGMDVIRQFHFDEPSGVMTPIGEIASGVKVGKRALGPRYLCFAKDMPTCYTINEISSQVAVFAYDAAAAAGIASAHAKGSTAQESVAAVKAAATPTLRLIQTASTIPEAFPSEMNTCGRITIHPTGDFVVASNRGHDSIAVHRIHRRSQPPGMLTLAGIFHTRGETPRHFQFDRSGQWLLVANQDSNTVSVFSFNTSTGALTYTGNTYSCPSPNFVCVWDNM